jgi:hypothetical protein
LHQQWEEFKFCEVITDFAKFSLRLQLNVSAFRSTVMMEKLPYPNGAVQSTTVKLLAELQVYVPANWNVEQSILIHQN